MTVTPTTTLNALAWVAERLAWERLLRRLERLSPEPPATAATPAGAKAA
jgi:hypothetical protein